MEDLITMIRKVLNARLRAYGIWCLLWTAFIAGCATNVQNALPEGSLQSSGDYEYIIGAGDTLDIFVWGYDDLSVALPVRPDGRITTRLVEDMLASGKTPTQLARDIENEYKKYVRNPTVSVTISEFVGSPTQQIKVVGAGAEPRTIPFTKGMTLLDMMIDVGGLGEFSDGNKAVLIRKDNGENGKYTLRLSDLLKRGDISANILMRPGDIVIIPESWF